MFQTYEHIHAKLLGSIPSWMPHNYEFVTFYIIHCVFYLVVRLFIMLVGEKDEYELLLRAPLTPFWLPAVFSFCLMSIKYQWVYGYTAERFLPFFALSFVLNMVDCLGLFSMAVDMESNRLALWFICSFIWSAAALVLLVPYSLSLFAPVEFVSVPRPNLGREEEEKNESQRSDSIPLTQEYILSPTLPRSNKKDL